MKVSKCYSPMEMERARRQWAKAFSPVSVRERDAWQHDWEDMLTKLPYVQGARGATGNTYRALVTVRGTVTMAAGNLEPIKRDLEKLWDEQFAPGHRAFHTFVDSVHGFEMQFGALTQLDQFVTGSVLIVHKEKN